MIIFIPKKKSYWIEKSIKVKSKLVLVFLSFFLSFQDPEFLKRAFTLISHLAFVVTSLKIIVQYGGIAMVNFLFCFSL